MSDRLKPPPVLPKVRIKLHPKAQLLLRLSLQNQSSETMLVRPVLDDWIADDDRIFSTQNLVDPAYIYLFPGDRDNCCQTMTIQMPLEVRSGQHLRSWLRFPGLLEEGISIVVEIQPESPDIQTIEYPLEVTFPLQQLDDPKTSMLSYDRTTTGVFGLISGLIDLDRIPARWLVAELIVMVSQKGEDYGKTAGGRQLLARLQRTAFWQNGVSAIATAKIPAWIADTLSMSDQVLQRHQQEERLLYIWERWLLSLVASDVEVPETNKTIEAPLFLAGEFAAKLGTDNDRWLSNFLLGLAVLSPRIASTLESICANPAEISRSPGQAVSQQATIASYHLATGLPGLDMLPSRWLVLELLLILARKGDSYATSAAGKELLDRLRLTRFCKNGVLSLATAQAARWIAVSHATASSFHVSIGSPGGQMGLLEFWEQWLWNMSDLAPNPQNWGLSMSDLAPNPQNWGLSMSDRKIQVPHASAETLVKKLGMDAQAWFLKILLGLILVSPRMAAILQAIASTAPEAPPEPPTPTVRIKDILGETGSLQR